MHVLILNQTFYPEVAATAQLMWDLAQHLAGHGHEVTALASRVVYGTDQVHEKAHEHIGRIDIRRVSGTRFGKKHIAGRMCDFLSFYAAAMLELHRVRRPDVILALTSPPMVAALGMLQKQFSDGPRRTRLVYHVMDMYPDAAISMNVMREGSLVERLMSSLTRRTLECSDAIIALGRDMAERLESRYQLKHASRKIHIIPPWSDGTQLHPLDKRDTSMASRLGVRDTFNIVYSGNLGMAHDLETMIGAIERLRDDAGIRWLFIGGGNRFGQLKDAAGKAGWTNVTFMGYQDREALIESLNIADVHLVSQLPAFTGIVVPSKLYGIMAVGKPSVMIGPDDAECSRVIRESGCGTVIRNGDVDGLVAALLRLRDDAILRQTQGQAARRMFLARYDGPIACRRIEDLLQSVVTP